MNKILRSSMILMAGAMLFVACQKDGENLVDLTAVVSDQPTSNSKVYLDGNLGYWQHGDQVMINGANETYNKYTLSVQTDGSTTAKILNVVKDENDKYTAAYPASQVSAINNGTSVTMTIPQKQTYQLQTNVYEGTTDSQHVEMPMVAYSKDGSSLKFYNAASLIRLNLVNNTGKDFQIHYVTVTATTNNLSGTGTVSVAGLVANPQTLPSFLVTEEDAEKSVTLDCCDAHPLVENGKNIILYLVVAPFGSNESRDQLNVTVMAEDGDNKKYTFNVDSRASGLYIERGQIGAVKVTMTAGLGTQSEFWGQGTKDCPYLITSESDLINMRDLINSASTGITYNKPTVYYKQTTDIDLSENEDYNDWGSSECPAIGDFTKASSFGANYDGDGHYVKLNITYATSANAQCGYALFGIAGNGNVIKNLTIKGNIMPGNRMYIAGGLIGRITGSITVDNCTNEADVRSTYQSKDQTKYGYGGICGTIDASNTSDITFKKCTNLGTIWDSNNSAGGICGAIIKCNKCSFIECNNGTADNTESKDKIRSWGAPSLGGICGYVNSSVVDTVVFDSCCNYYKMRNAGNVGGIVGRAIQVCKFNKCHNSKTITGTAGYCGGIIGYSTKSLIFTTRNTNSGPILTGSGYAGGLIGYIYNSTSLLTCRGITRNESTGTVTSINNGTDYSWVGGIVGYAYGGVDMENCINKANVTGKQHVGGIVGWLGTKCTMNNVGNTGIITQQNGNNLAYMGGLIGYASAPRGGVLIKNCFNTGNLISGKSCIGGLIGYLYFDTPIPTTVVTNIYNCYCSNCEITISNSAYYAGGIIGQYRLGNSTSTDNYTMAIHNCYVSATISTGSGNYRGVLYGTYGNNYKVYTENNYYSNTISATTKHGRSSAATIPHYIDGDTIPKTTINDTAYTNVVNALNAARRAINNGTAIYTELTNNATLRASLTGLNAWKEEDGKIVFE